MGSRPTFLESLSAYARKELLHVDTTTVPVPGTGKVTKPGGDGLYWKAAALPADVGQVTSQASAARESALQAQLRTAHALLGQQAKANQEHAAAQQASKTAAGRQQASASALSRAVKTAREENEALRAALHTAQSQCRQLQDQLLREQSAGTELREKYLQVVQLSGVSSDGSFVAALAQPPKLSRLQSELEILTQQNCSLQSRIKQLTNQLADVQCQASGIRGRKAAQDAVSQRKAAMQAAKVQAAKSRVQQLSGQLESKDKTLQKKDQYITRLEQALLQQHRLLQQLTTAGSPATTQPRKQQGLLSHRAAALDVSETRQQVDHEPGTDRLYISDDLASIRCIEAELLEMQQQLSVLACGSAKLPQQAAVKPGKLTSVQPCSSTTADSEETTPRGMQPDWNSLVPGQVWGGTRLQTATPQGRLQVAGEVNQALSGRPVGDTGRTDAPRVLAPSVQKDPLLAVATATAAARKPLQPEHTEDIAAAASLSQCSPPPAAIHDAKSAAVGQHKCQANGPYGAMCSAETTTPSTINTFLGGLISPQASPTPQPRTGAGLLQAVSRSLPTFASAAFADNTEGRHMGEPNAAGQVLQACRHQASIKQGVRVATTQQVLAPMQSANQSAASHQAVRGVGNRHVSAAALACLAARRHAAAQRHADMHSPAMGSAGRSHANMRPVSAARQQTAVNVAVACNRSRPQASQLVQQPSPTGRVKVTCQSLSRDDACAAQAISPGKHSSSLEQAGDDALQCGDEQVYHDECHRHDIQGNKAAEPECSLGTGRQYHDTPPSGQRHGTHSRLFVEPASQYSSLAYQLSAATTASTPVRKGNKLLEQPQSPVATSAPGTTRSPPSWSSNNLAQSQRFMWTQVERLSDCLEDVDSCYDELCGPSQLLDLHVPAGCLLGVQPHIDACLRLSWSPPNRQGSCPASPTSSHAPASGVKHVLSMCPRYHVDSLCASAQNTPPPVMCSSDAEVTLGPRYRDAVDLQDQGIRTSIHTCSTISPDGDICSQPSPRSDAFCQEGCSMDQLSSDILPAWTQALQQETAAVPMLLVPEPTVSSWHSLQPTRAHKPSLHSTALVAKCPAGADDTWQVVYANTVQHSATTGSGAAPVPALVCAADMQPLLLDVSCKTQSTQADGQQHPDINRSDKAVDLQVLEQASLSLQQLTARLRLTSDTAIMYTGTPDGTA